LGISFCGFRFVPSFCDFCGQIKELIREFCYFKLHRNIVKKKLHVFPDPGASVAAAKQVRVRHAVDSDFRE
jgi:hypothetical protein